MDNALLVGLCGQSACGKTTLLECLSGETISGREVHIAPNFIKSICADPNQRILSPDDVIEFYENTPERIQIHYLNYVLSQKTLQQEYANRIDARLSELRDCENPVVLLSDRTFIDFYLYTKGALAYFERVTGIRPGDECFKLLEQMQISTSNLMKVFFGAIITILPHGGDINDECVGRRKTGLEPEFSNDNWYGSISDIDYTKVTNSTSMEIEDRCNDIKTVIAKSS